MFSTLSDVLITYIVLSAHVLAHPVPQLDYINPVCVEVDIDELDKLNISYPLSEENPVFTNEQWERFKDLGKNLPERKLKDKFYRGMRVLSFALKNYNDTKMILNETIPEEQENLGEGIQAKGMTNETFPEVTPHDVLNSKNILDESLIPEKDLDNSTSHEDIDHAASDSISKFEKENMSSQASQNEEIKQLYGNNYLTLINVNASDGAHSVVPDDDGMTEKYLQESLNALDNRTNEETTSSLGADNESLVYQKLNLNISMINQHQTIASINKSHQAQKNLPSTEITEIGELGIDYYQTSNEMQTTTEAQNTSTNKIEPMKSRANEVENAPSNEASKDHTDPEQESDLNYSFEDQSKSEPRASIKDNKIISSSKEDFEDSTLDEQFGGYQQTSNDSTLLFNYVSTTEKNYIIISKSLTNETTEDNPSELSAESLLLVKNKTSIEEDISESGSSLDRIEESEIYDNDDTTTEINNEYYPNFNTNRFSIEGNNKKQDEDTGNNFLNGSSQYLGERESDNGTLKKMYLSSYTDSTVIVENEQTTENINVSESNANTVQSEDELDRNQFEDQEFSNYTESTIIPENELTTKSVNLLESTGDAPLVQSGRGLDRIQFEDQEFSNYSDSTIIPENEQTTISVNLSESKGDAPLLQNGRGLDRNQFEDQDFSEITESTIIAENEQTTTSINLSERIGNATSIHSGKKIDGNQYEYQNFSNYTESYQVSTVKAEIETSTKNNNPLRRIDNSTSVKSEKEIDNQYENQCYSNYTESTIIAEKEQTTESVNLSERIGDATSVKSEEENYSNQLDDRNLSRYTESHQGSTIKPEINTSTEYNNPSRVLSEATFVKVGEQLDSNQFMDQKHSSYTEIYQGSAELETTTENIHHSERIGTATLVQSGKELGRNLFEDQDSSDFTESTIIAENEQTTKSINLSEIIEDATLIHNGKDISSKQYKDKNFSNYTESYQGSTVKAEIEASMESNLLNNSTSIISDKELSNQNEDQHSSNNTESNLESTIRDKKEQSNVISSEGIGESNSNQIGEESDSDQFKENYHHDHVELNERSTVIAEIEHTTGGRHLFRHTDVTQSGDESDKDKLNEIFKPNDAVKAEGTTENQASEGIDNLDGDNNNSLDQMSAQSHNLLKTETSVINKSIDDVSNGSRGDSQYSNEEESSFSSLTNDKNKNHNDVNSDGIDGLRFEGLSDKATTYMPIYSTEAYENGNSPHSDTDMNDSSTPSNSQSTYNQDLGHDELSITTESAITTSNFYDDHFIPSSEGLSDITEMSSNQEESTHSSSAIYSSEVTSSVDKANDEYSITQYSYPTGTNVLSTTQINQVISVEPKTSQHVDKMMDELSVTTQRPFHTDTDSDEGFVPYLSPVSKHYSQNLPLPSPVPKDVKRENCLKVPEYVYTPRR